jgi:hypothetical protein
VVSMADWQPIESAPKGDGFVDIVFCPDNHESERIMMGSYRRGFMGRPGHWQIHIDGQCIEPTHWMPLPAPPGDQK